MASHSCYCVHTIRCAPSSHDMISSVFSLCWSSRVVLSLASSLSFSPVVIAALSCLSACASPLPSTLPFLDLPTPSALRHHSFLLHDCNFSPSCRGWPFNPAKLTLIHVLNHPPRLLTLHPLVQAHLLLLPLAMSARLYNLSLLLNLIRFNVRMSN